MVPGNGDETLMLAEFLSALFLHEDKPVRWMYWGLFSEGKLKVETENLSCTNPNLRRDA